MAKPKNKEVDDPRLVLITRTREALEALRMAMQTRQGNRGAMALVHQLLAAYRTKHPDVDFGEALAAEHDHVVTRVRNAEDAIRQSAAWGACALIALGEELLPTGWSIDAGRRLTWFLLGLAQRTALASDESREQRAVSEEKDLFPLLHDGFLWLRELDRRIEVTGKPIDWVPASRYVDATDSRVASPTAVRRFAELNSVKMQKTPKGRVKLRLDGDAMRRALAGKKRAADRAFAEYQSQYELAYQAKPK